jgi:selenium-binding protein 1
MNLRPDPTFTPHQACDAGAGGEIRLHSDAQPGRLAVRRDCRRRPESGKSDTYGQIVHQVIVPYKGDEFHHFGWNACSSVACRRSQDTRFLERRYLIVPGIRSSRIYIIDVKEPA